MVIKRCECCNRKYNYQMSGEPQHEGVSHERYCPICAPAILKAIREQRQRGGYVEKRVKRVDVSDLTDFQKERMKELSDGYGKEGAARPRMVVYGPHPPGMEYCDTYSIADNHISVFHDRGYDKTEYYIDAEYTHDGQFVEYWDYGPEQEHRDGDYCSLGNMHHTPTPLIDSDDVTVRPLPEPMNRLLFTGLWQDIRQDNIMTEL